MQDYEYMLIAIDEVLSHDVTGIICMENYKNCYFPNGFRKVFDQFGVFQEEYENNKEKLQEEIEVVKFQARCYSQKEQLLRDFINELKFIESGIDYEEEVKKYRVSLEEEDVHNLEMELAIYPFLISLIREREEKVKENDEQF